ncbi:hypothetical protein JCM10213_008929 [Rhodosporidiobolus nylandii]
MSAGHDNRPQTASRPRTARPLTAGGDLGTWDEEWDEDDDDVGMFSFNRPGTGEAPQPGTFSPSAAPFTPPSAASPHSPYSTIPFGFSPYPPQPSHPPSTAAPSEAHRPQTAVSSHPPPSSFSAAAAYAQQVHASSLANPLSSQQPQSPEPQAGPRKRGSWTAPESPNHVVGNPYEHDLRREPSWRTSDGSSRDKIEAMTSSWADHQRSPSYALDSNGQAIMLDELGAPIGPVTTRDEKMLAEAQLGHFAQYGGDFGGGRDVFYEEEEDSPYPEVRASVSNIDDPEMPILTFRSWFIGLLFCIVISALNCFFYIRYPAPLITPIVTQVLSYPMGKLLARYLPFRSWETPAWTRRLGVPETVSFNPGPFNIKEHTVLVIMANVSTAPAYALNFSLASDKFYGVAQGAGFDILLVLTTQMLGFGAAGLCRRFLVWPAALVWPSNLVYCTLLNTLHAEDEDDGNGPTRFRFFLYIICGAFAWYCVPGFLFVGLSAFSWVCWIAPKNVVVNQLFGVSSGLGMGIFTFDWSQIAYVTTPLIVPWWAEVNVFAAFVLAFWILAPIMYYTNVWDSAYLPMSTSEVFDRFGAVYNTSAVVDVNHLRLNETAYHEYSPLFLPITYATVYGVAFMLSMAVIVHTVLYHYKDIWARVKRVNDKEDVHMKLMKNYPEVPDWWYFVFLVVAFALAIVAIACWNTQMPVWSVVVAVFTGLLYMLPGGLVFATASYQVSINVIVELFAGYIIPGLPLANMLFKVYATQTLGTGLTFVQDLKLGHYMKIPPRASFSVQVVATVVTSVVQVGVKRWLVSTVPDLCASNQKALLSCPSTRVLYSSSIVWGLIGPARQFSIGKMYNPILYWLVAGAVLPFITWLLAKRYPKSWVSYINLPVALSGIVYMPPATGINYSSWFLVGFIFQFLMRRRHFRWWSKYNFVLSAGLDAGTVLSGVIIFFCLQLPRNGTISVNWWGNSVYTKTLDWAGVSYKTPPVEGFGPKTW